MDLIQHLPAGIGRGLAGANPLGQILSLMLVGVVVWLSFKIAA